MADGTVTQSFSTIQFFNTSVLTLSWTASSTDATIPPTTISTEITNKIKGMYIAEGRTNPGSTPPTPNYDITVTDTDGIDLFGGELNNRSATTSERAIPALPSGGFGTVPVDGVLTITITNNLVNSATGTLKIFFERS